MTSGPQIADDLNETNKRNLCFFLHGLLLAEHGWPWPDRTREAIQLQPPQLEALLDSLHALRVELDGRHGSGWTMREISRLFPPALDFMRRL